MRDNIQKTSLPVLYVSSAVPFVADLPKIRSLSLKGNPLTELSFLWKAGTLKSLFVSGCGLEDEKDVVQKEDQFVSNNLKYRVLKPVESAKESRTFACGRAGKKLAQKVDKHFKI